MVDGTMLKVAGEYYSTMMTQYDDAQALCRNHRVPPKVTFWKLSRS